MRLDCVANSLGRMVPKAVPGLGKLVPFAGPYARLDGSYVWTPTSFPRRVPAPTNNKVAPDLTEAIKRSGLQSGMTISFHHHLRNGDAVVGMVLAAIEKLGIKGITLAPRISVPQYLVDQVAVVDSIGDPSRIATGATRISRDPVQLRIAELAFGLIKASGSLKAGCSFQTGGGGPSLAVARYVKEYMKAESPSAASPSIRGGRTSRGPRGTRACP